jgi:hypothetical protein
MISYIYEMFFICAFAKAETKKLLLTIKSFYNYTLNDLYFLPQYFRLIELKSGV